MPQSLREKLVVAFVLMSIVPLLVLGYVVSNYVFPHLDTLWDLSLVVLLTVGISFLGLVVARSIVLPVVKLASEAQAIAEGHLEQQVDVQAPGEVGALGVALNQITVRVRENMEQLRVYGEQTRHLNLEINKRILTFSHLLQVSNLITQSANVEETLSFILEKLTHLEEAQLSCLLQPTEEPNVFLVRSARCVDPDQAEALMRTKRVVAPWLARVLSRQEPFIIDGVASSSHEGELLQQLFGMTNGVCQPLVSLGKVVGVLISANRKTDFRFDKDTLELLGIFAKQMSIAYENDLLARRAEELRVTDELTGLYNASYMKERLEEEILRALRYHRSCSLVVFNLDNFRQFSKFYGESASEDILRQVASLLKGETSEVDRIGRMDSDAFAVILPERNKREAIDFAESVRRKIGSASFINGSKRLAGALTVSGGVSENPLDGSTSDELLTKATEALKQAKVQGKNRVVTC